MNSRSSLSAKPLDGFNDSAMMVLYARKCSTREDADPDWAATRGLTAKGRKALKGKVGASRGYKQRELKTRGHLFRNGPE